MLRVHAICIRGCLVAVLAALATGSLSGVARGDWINLSGAETSRNIAEIYVLRDRVKLVLEIHVDDVMAFEELVPDEMLAGSGIERPPPTARIRHFAEQSFVVVAPDGTKLPARLDLVELRRRVDRQSVFAGMINPYTQRRVPEAPADKRVLYAELSYPFEGEPTELSFVPPLDAEGRATVSIGFIVYHKAVPVIDFRYLGAPVRLLLDWKDPWYSKFENRNLTRHHKNPLMSFLYVEPYEVRHEVLARVVDMARWMDLGLRGDAFIEVDELLPLKQRIGEFLLTKNPVRIDGRELPPILDRSNFVKLSMNGIQLLELPERLEISTAIVGVILTYLTDGMPQEATVDWELFSEQIQRVPTTAIDPAGPMKSFVDPEDPTLTWTNFLTNYQVPTVVETEVAGTLPDLRVPLASAACLLILLPVGWTTLRQRRRGAPLGKPLAASALLVLVGLALLPFAHVSVARPALMAPVLDEARARIILENLLRNVYRSFDFREESTVYDKLATSVTGDLLADVYLQSRRSLAIEQAGGAQARIQEVEVLAAAAAGPLDGRLAYDVRASWTAAGSVGHWGHVHQRKNLYEADLRIEAVNGSWKLVGLELLDEKRIDAGAGRVPGGSPPPPTATQP
jgi:hypothetical protein